MEIQQLTSIEQKILFADFMEIGKQDKSNGGEIYLYEHPITGEYADPEYLPYTEICENTNWNLLMPVIDKIYELDQHDEEGNNVGDITHALVDIDINRTYEAVVKFIQWYNKQKQ